MYIHLALIDVITESFKILLDQQLKLCFLSAILRRSFQSLHN